MKVEQLRWPHPGLPARVRWHLRRWLLRHPAWLNRFGARVTVFDAFGGLGDTLLTAIVCRHLKQQFPRLRLNCLTPNPDLLLHDPHLDSINEPEDYLSIWHWYLDLLDSKDPHENVLTGTFHQLGFRHWEYRARVYLTKPERQWAQAQLSTTEKPLLSFQVCSREPVKTWPVEFWTELLDRLRPQFDLVQLGTETEPEFPGVRRFAGKATKRESMALLSQVRLHVGPDSFLMHAANGLDVPMVMILGGSRAPGNAAYGEHLNLFTLLPCSPCGIHAERGETCPHDLECMRRITATQVHSAVLTMWKRLTQPGPVTAAMPLFNACRTVQTALASLRTQTLPPCETRVVDDASTDQGVALAQSSGARVIIHDSNLGRGATRARLMSECDTDFVLMCDAGIALPTDFTERALKWFDDPKVAAVCGRIEQPAPRSLAERWRGRHLFKTAPQAEVDDRALLSTAACLLRTKAVREAGGFHPALRSGEDADLGRRLLDAGWKVISDPALRGDELRVDTPASVLERYARWNSPHGLRGRHWLRQLAYTLKVMIPADLRAGDPLAGLLSLAAPFYQLVRR